MTLLVGNQINGARLLTLRAMLQLEMKGLSRSRSPSAYSMIKRELGLRGTRASVLEQMNAIRDDLLGVKHED